MSTEKEKEILSEVERNTSVYSADGQLRVDKLFQPAFNKVYNLTLPFILGKELRQQMVADGILESDSPCPYDELFLQGGRACVDCETLIATPRGDVKIKDFTGGEIYSIGKDGKVVIADACAPTKYAPEKLYTIKTSSGKKVTCTSEHRFLTERGWIPLHSLRVGDKIISSRGSRDTSASVVMRIAKGERDLLRSYYDEHLSVLHEDVDHLTRRLLGSIYRYSRDYHLCDEQLLEEADTYQDVLQLLSDARTHIQDDSHTDVTASYDTYIRSFQYEYLPSSCDFDSRSEDKCSTTLETQIYETLSELLSEISSLSHKSPQSDNLLGRVQEAASLVLATKHWLCCHTDSHRAGYIQQVLCDTLLRTIDDQTFSDDLSKLDSVILNRLNYIINDEVVSIAFEKEDCFYDIFVPFYNNYIGNGIVHHNSGKSYFASVFIWLALENDPKKNAVIIRKVASSLRKSCWKQMMKVRKRLGYEHWIPNKTEMTFTNKFTGQQIFFVGLDDEEKVRGITVETGYIAIAWFEEAKQFGSMEEIEQAIASTVRGGADDDERDYDEDDEGDQEYMTILTYNPPKSMSEWINVEARMKKPNRFSHRSTYLTMPKAWLGKKILSEIAAMMKNKPKQYRHMYLGIVTGTGGEYFRNLVIRKITKEERDSFDYFNMGIDWGMTDPNVFEKTYIDEDRSIGYVLDGIYQDEWDESCGKTKYQQFAEEVVRHTRDCPDDPIWSDAQGKAEGSILSAAPYNLCIEFAPKQGANGRDEGYRYMRSLEQLVLDEDLPQGIIDNFVYFECMQAPGGKGWLDKPGKKDDHGPDCFRYSEWEAIRNGSVSSASETDEYN